MNWYDSNEIVPGYPSGGEYSIWINEEDMFADANARCDLFFLLQNAGLTEAERQIFNLRSGLAEDGCPLTISEIAEQLGVSRQKISALEKALRKKIVFYLTRKQPAFYETTNF